MNINVTFGRETQPRLVADDEASSRWRSPAAAEPRGRRRASTQSPRTNRSDDAETRTRAGDKALTRGHRIRRAVWDAAAADDRIVRFASERSKLPRTDGARVLAAAPEAKAGSVAPFAVHVAIENVRRAGYFTEKLLDCFLLRTVPVYWGCPDLAAHGFDIDGVVVIDDGGDEAAVACAAVAAVGRALDAPPPAAAIERNYARAQDFLDLEGRLVSVIDAALDAARSS